MFPVPLMGRLNTHLLKVAIAHLLRNAIEASRPGGTIQVRPLEDKHSAS